MLLDFTCEICNSTDYKIKSHYNKRLGIKNKKYQVLKCKRCGFHSLFPIPDLDDFTKIYNNYLNEGDRIEVESNRINFVYKNRVNLIKKYSFKNAKILDIGAGLGGFLSVAKMEGFDVTGIEFTSEQVEFAKKHFNINLIHGSFEDIYKSFKSGFDVIHMHHVLEHVRHPKQILFYISELLNKNGIFVFEIPNQFFVLKKEIYLKVGLVNEVKPYNPYHHLHFFSPKTTRKLLRDSGFEIIELNQPKKNPNSVAIKVYNILAKSLGYGISNTIEVVAKLK